MDNLNPTHILIAVAIIAWILQIILGWWQVTRFNRAFTLLCNKGNVGVGRSGGRFTPKVVIAIAFNQQNQVVDSLIIKGFSVFSKPQPITALQGLFYNQIDPKIIYPHNQNCQQALKIAIALK